MSARAKLLVLFLVVAFGGLLIYRLTTYNNVNVAGITESNPNVFPNSEFTPGDISSNVTSDQVCTPGFTKTVRNVTTATKKLVFEEYNISYPPPKGAYEVDHFIPLELGGSNEITNLWPEPADPKPGFHQKDEVENYLHEQVCKGTISLEQAQESIRTNWLTVYQKMPK